ncbi:MAG: hypothetical protein KKE76_15810 [Gammaproteobacteria bacterium]|nr:hypothetical protein [Gammaproteobacteria bacterium]
MPAVQPYQRIYLLSHMRAYSSLIGHILGSHPHINGYYEMHLPYTRAESLDEQLCLYGQTESLKPDSLYLFDKLLHNDYPLDTAILEGIGNRILLSIRSPEDSLKSILHLFRAKGTDHPYADPLQASNYYIERLEALAGFSENNSGRYYYFDAELIISDSHHLLRAITRWCELDPALSGQYQTFSQTGKAGAGDSSSLIKRGMIDSSARSHIDIPLDAELVARAEAAYEKYRDVMLRHAKEILTL